jgi:hypothetical protein
MWRVRVECGISKATRSKTHVRTSAPTPTSILRTRTHTQKYVIHIAFSRQQYFGERASVLRYTYIACLVLICLSYYHDMYP